MDLELHEQILFKLYDSRYSEGSIDLLSAFKSFPESIVRTTAKELKDKGYVKLEYPFLGIGFMDQRTGEISWPYARNEDFIKARITTSGIDYVNKELKGRREY